MNALCLASTYIDRFRVAPLIIESYWLNRILASCIELYPLKVGTSLCLFKYRITRLLDRFDINRGRGGGGGSGDNKGLSHLLGARCPGSGS